MANCNSCGGSVLDPLNLNTSTATSCSCNTPLALSSDVPASNDCCGVTSVSLDGGAPQTGDVILNTSLSITALSPIQFLANQITHLNSGVTANSYGSATQVPVITVDAKGHITGVSLVTITTAALSTNLQNLDALTGVGYLVKTATNTWVFRVLSGAAGRIALTNPAGTAGNTTIDLASSGVTPGIYGSSTQYPVITVDSYGRITNVTLQTKGDGWGSQVVEHDATLAGTGVTGSLLKLAQQGATNGQTLVWNGTSWVPSTITVTGDNWGSQVTVTDGTLQGNGLLATPLKVNNVIKIKEAEYNTGNPGAYAGSHSFTCSNINATYLGTPNIENCLVIYGIVTIDIIDVISSGAAHLITVRFQGHDCYVASLIDTDHDGVIVGEFKLTQDVTTPANYYVRGMTELLTVGLTCSSSLPKYSKLTAQSFTNPTIEIVVDTNVKCTVGVTLTVHRKAFNMYQTQ